MFVLLLLMFITQRRKEFFTELPDLVSHRHCVGDVLCFNQEAQQPETCKRRFRKEEEEMKKRRRKRIGCKENKHPGDCLQRERRDQRG